MKFFGINLLVIFLSIQAFGQNSSCSQAVLSQKETARIFTDSLKKQFNILYPISRVYKCTDKSGQFLIVLTESNDMITAKDTMHQHIQAINLSYNKNELIKKWEMNDAKNKETKDKEAEISIWFWTSYCVLQDIDKDSLIDPILVYGTKGANEYDDGRIKIIICYKGQKIALRHQNGVLDFERNTRVDKGFYSLPIKIQIKVRELMKKMTSQNRAVFPSGWERAMAKKELKISENK